MTGYIALSWIDLALAALLLVVNAALSLLLGLGIGRRLAIAAARMVVQLALIGLVLDALFGTASPWLVLAAAAVMLGFAGWEARSRQERRFRGAWSYGLGTASMTLAAVIVTGLALVTAIGPDPWYDPRYAIPLLGMVLGNAMTGVSVGLDRLCADAVRDRAAIEAQLCLGSTAQEALRGAVRGAARAGMIPTINAMAAAGLVFLPGMMTGQILAGIAPMEAVKYQLLVMFLIAGGTGLGLAAAVLGGARLLTDGRHRLRLDRLAERAAG